MTKPEVTMQLHAFLDGELEFARHLEIEARLQHDLALRTELQGMERMRELGRTSADYHRAPAALRARMATGIDRPAEPPTRAAGIAQPVAPRRRAWIAAASALACTLVLVVGLAFFARQGGRDERIAQETIASHVRATLGQRLVDIAASDQHTVKPWLSSRLDFSPPVQEVAGAAFLGGRIDHLDGHPVAVLVYRQRQHVIDVFIWPEQRASAGIAAYAERGFNALRGSRAGMTHWVVSDLNRDELAAFAQSLDAGEAR